MGKGHVSVVLASVLLKRPALAAGGLGGGSKHERLVPLRPEGKGLMMPIGASRMVRLATGASTVGVDFSGAASRSAALIRRLGMRVGACEFGA